MCATELVKFDPKALAELDNIAKDCQMTLAKAGNTISGALAVAENMHRLRELVTPDMLKAVSALQGTPLGFKTDRSRAKSGLTEYSPNELRDVFIEATVRGFSAVGNEFNVIAGNFYGAKAGFERKVRTYPGLSEFQAMYDIEETTGGFAKVQCVATWVLDGKPKEFVRRKGNIKGQAFDNRIRVRINEGMGYDALLGKAQSKFYRAIYDYLIGAVTSTPEGDADEVLLDQNGGKWVHRSNVFDPAPAGPDESAQSVAVEAYRLRLSRIAAKNDVSAIARDAGKDASLTADGRAQVMVACSEAMKIWPSKIAASQSDAEPPFNPPTVEEAAAYAADKPEDESAAIAAFKAQIDAASDNNALQVIGTAYRGSSLSDVARVEIGGHWEKKERKLIRGQPGKSLLPS